MHAFITAVALGVIAALGAAALVPLSRAHADPAAIHYLYDDLDRLVGVVDQHGNVATYAYDAVGNLRRIDRVEAAATPGAVAITLVTPNQGVVDTIVRIFGKGFASTPGQNTVRFNGTQATVTSAAPNLLETRVPPGAMTGPITVQTPLGSAASPTVFRVVGVLAITPPGGVMLVGTSRQFTATDSGNTDTTFSWSVNGVAGGNTAVGTVTSTGVYTAPPGVPTPAAVTLTATATDDSRSTVSVSILIAAEPQFALQLASPVSVGVVLPPVTTPMPALLAAAPLALAVTVEPQAPGPTPAAGFAPPVTVRVASPAVGVDPVPAVGVASPVSVQVPLPSTADSTPVVGLAAPVAVHVSPTAGDPAPSPVVGVAPSIAVGVAAPADPPAPAPAVTVAGPVAVEVVAPPALGGAEQLYGLVALAVAPVITGVAPASAPAGATSVVVTLTGAGLAGATAVTFLGADGADSAISVNDMATDADGTRAVVTIALASHAAPGTRVVQVTAPTGASGAATRTSTPIPIGGNVFTVQ